MESSSARIHELTLDQRSRIIREIVELMRAEIADPGFIIGIKIGRADFNGKVISQPS